MVVRTASGGLINSERRKHPFPHYVANGGRENIGRWHQEAVDLTEIYETLWGDPVGARMIDIAIFCDSDETGDETLAYVADVRVQRR